MAMARSSADEVVAKGRAVYEHELRANVEPGNVGRFIAIDVNSGEYEIGDDHYATVELLKRRDPDAVVYTIKIGYDATAKIGGRLRRVGEGAGS